MRKYSRFITFFLDLGNGKKGEKHCAKLKDSCYSLQLRERLHSWSSSDESSCRIGDVIVRFSPFFKMYTEYVKNFDHAVNTINTIYAKNSKFAAIMDEIHVR